MRNRLEPWGARAFALHDQPDAGLWEFRGRAHVHTYSSVMSWVACDRLARIAHHLGLGDRRDLWNGRATRVRELILARAVHKEGPFACGSGALFALMANGYPLR